MVEVPLPAVFAQAKLSRSDILHQRIDGAAAHRIAHRDVDAVHLRRKRVEQRHQQVALRQDEGGLHGGAGHPLPEDPGCQFGLPDGGRHADDLDFRHGKAFRVGAECLRELPDVLLHKDGGLVERVPDHLRRVVPAELRQGGVPHLREQEALTLAEGVQPDEDEPFRLGERAFQDVPGRHPVLQALGQRPVHHPLIGHSFLPQRLREIPVQGVQEVPDLQEAGLDVLVRIHGDGQPAGVVPEVGHKAVHRIALDVRQIGETVLQPLEIGHIGEQGLRVHQVLVHVVEVRQDHVAPEEELVQGLGLGVKGLVAGIQLGQKPVPVRHVYAADAVEEVVDGIHRRRGDRPGGLPLAHHLSQVLAEEDCRPPVGKDENEML